MIIGIFLNFISNHLIYETIKYSFNSFYKSFKQLSTMYNIHTSSEVSRNSKKHFSVTFVEILIVNDLITNIIHCFFLSFL